ncbi:MAG: hypothetical protein HYR88_11235 [Verrucomicrobia bacterium]|nr:hypothetical protein [Verrucomicrobiota bacterium]MBI3869369.1 hypothetical protein [Verrucomicrobiota bacterium]
MSLKTRIQSKVILWIWRRVPDCAEMARLSSRTMDHPAGLRVRIQMRLHMLICAWCQRYFHQIRTLRRIVRSTEARLEYGARQELSQDARRRIKQSLASKP